MNSAAFLVACHMCTYINKIIVCNSSCWQIKYDWWLIDWWYLYFNHLTSPDASNKLSKCFVDVCSVYFSGTNFGLFHRTWVVVIRHRCLATAGSMLTSLSPITPPPAVSDMHYPWNYFHQTESPSSSTSSAAAGGAFSWYGTRWPSGGDLKSPFGAAPAPGNYFPSYDTGCFGSASAHHQLNMTSAGPAQVSQ